MYFCTKIQGHCQILKTGEDKRLNLKNLSLKNCTKLLILKG